MASALLGSPSQHGSMRKAAKLALLTDLLVVVLVPYLFMACCAVVLQLEEAFEQTPGRREFLGAERFEQISAEETREALRDLSLFGAMLLAPAVPLGCVWLLLRRKLQRGGDALPSVAPADQV